MRAGTYYDRSFKRWICLLRFDVLHENRIDVVARIPMWLSLGKDEKPRASRRSNYLKEWVKANEGPPARGEPLWSRKSSLLVRPINPSLILAAFSFLVVQTSQHVVVRTFVLMRTDMFVSSSAEVFTVLTE
jgi:hypothetical protein